MEARAADSPAVGTNLDPSQDNQNVVEPKAQEPIAIDQAELEKECREIEKPASLGHQLLKFATSESIEMMRLSSLFLFMYYKKGTYDTAIYCSSAAAGGLAVFDGIRLWRELSRQDEIQSVNDQLNKGLKSNRVSLRQEAEFQDKISVSFKIFLYFILFLRLSISISNAAMRRVSYNSKDEDLKEPWPYIILEVLAFLVRFGMRIVNECYIMPRTAKLDADYHRHHGAYLALTQRKAAKERNFVLTSEAETKIPDETVAAAEEMQVSSREILNHSAGPT